MSERNAILDLIRLNFSRALTNEVQVFADDIGQTVFNYLETIPDFTSDECQQVADKTTIAILKAISELETQACST